MTSQTMEPARETSFYQKAAAYLAIAARVAVGAIFVYLGIVKALHPFEFLKVLKQFGIVHPFLIQNAIAGILPWMEIFLGILLIIGVRPRATSFLVLGLLLLFTGAVALRALAIYRGGGTPFCAIRFDCGCGTGEVWVCHKLALNSLLIGLACLISASPRQRFCLWSDTAPRD